MNKTERLVIIKARWVAHYGLPIPGVLPVSRLEIRSTVEETVSSRLKAMDDSLATGDEVEAGSSLCFDSVIQREREEDFLLNEKERRELAKVWQRKPAPAPVSVDFLESFSPVEGADYVPVRSREIESYVDGLEWFEQLVFSRPLLLMA
jgi:hypothetical protein